MELTRGAPSLARFVMNLPIGLVLQSRPARSSFCNRVLTQAGRESTLGRFLAAKAEAIPLSVVTVSLATATVGAASGAAGGLAILIFTKRPPLNRAASPSVAETTPVRSKS